MPGHSGYCESVVREADKDRFLATLFAPARCRPDLYALYAFDIETAAVASRIRDPLAGEVRFQWWHDAISGTVDATGHPVAEALLDVLSRHGLTNASALALIDLRREALYGGGALTDGDFELYSSATTGTIYAMAAQVLGGVLTDAARLASHHAGVAAAAARAEPADVAFDRLAYARRHLAAVKALVAEMPAPFLPAFLPLALLRPSLEHPSLPQWRKQWILWRASKNLAAYL